MELKDGTSVGAPALCTTPCLRWRTGLWERRLGPRKEGPTVPLPVALVIHLPDGEPPPLVGPPPRDGPKVDHWAMLSLLVGLICMIHMFHLIRP